MKTLAPHISVLIALSTLIGLAVHDTKIDTMAAFAVAVPAVVAVYEGAHLLGALSGEAHTHIERVSFASTFHQLTGLQARLGEDKRYKTPRAVPKGHHAFDNYNLPVVI